jgi:hypothetical protein
MIRFRLALICALSLACTNAMAQAPPAKTLTQAQAKRYARIVLKHRFGKGWTQRDKNGDFFKCTRRAPLKFRCRVVWLRQVVVYDGKVGISLRPDPADDGWYYDLKIKRSNYGCSNLCRKTFAAPWTRGGTAG